MTPTIVREGTPPLRDVPRGTPFHNLHEPMEFPASCATCADERDHCKCLWYGHGLSLTRVQASDCEIHG